MGIPFLQLLLDHPLKNLGTLFCESIHQEGLGGGHPHRDHEVGIPLMVLLYDLRRDSEA
jgi:hypothetical protein